MRILVLTRYGSMAASTRQRFLAYREFFAENGVTLELKPLLGDDQVARITRHGRSSVIRAAASYPVRALGLVKERKADLLWVHSELFPFLPGWLERLAFRARSPVVLEFDDAMFHGYDRHPNPLVRLALGGKFPRIMAAAEACICGNQYLLDYALKWCPNSALVPTVVDTDRYQPRPAARKSDPLVVGWMGSHSTWQNVAPLLPTILDVCRRHGAEFHVIGAGPQVEEIEGVTALAWSEDKEVAQLQRMDVGIMPLLDRPFQRGKCGYKLIQYMAVGVPVVASPVGVNSKIAQQGTNGMLASTPTEWADALDHLLRRADLRRNYGAAGRELVERSYSVRAHRERLLGLLVSAAG